MSTQRIFSQVTVLVVVGLFSLSALAQNTPVMGSTSVHGSVRDSVSHHALQYVIVVLEGQNSGYSGQSETDGLGRFQFQGMPPAVYIVRIHHPGYEDASERIDLTIAGNNYLDFQLKPEPGSKNSANTLPAAGSATTSASSLAAPQKARKELNAGQELLASGKEVDKAIEHLQKAVKIYPNFADAYFLLGTAYMQQSNAADAQAALEKAVQIEPKMGPGYITLGMVENHVKDYAAAEKNLTKALDFNPESFEAHYELGKAYWGLGRWQDAEPHALKAASLQPNFPPVHVLLGNVYLRKQNPQEALKEFQEYLQLDPNGPMAQGTQAMVNKLQSSSKSAQ
jgi:tetratricopeptide (TPR) repeat protein